MNKTVSFKKILGLLSGIVVLAFLAVPTEKISLAASLPTNTVASEAEEGIEEEQEEEAEKEGDKMAGVKRKQERKINDLTTGVGPALGYYLPFWLWIILAVLAVIIMFGLTRKKEEGTT